MHEHIFRADIGPVTAEAQELGKGRPATAALALRAKHAGEMWIQRVGLSVAGGGGRKTARGADPVISAS
ncbi:MULTISPECIES: hypothetical protein [Phaeobacter]|uniref:hypothetical protein n=1 Tax=Phaeobacter TaxID=302485 RepID=UPI000B022CA6|nr:MULTISPECIES: hypothetical protein [Phaeobacter]